MVSSVISGYTRTQETNLKTIHGLFPFPLPLFLPLKAMKQQLCYKQQEMHEMRSYHIKPDRLTGQEEAGSLMYCEQISQL